MGIFFHPFMIENLWCFSIHGFKSIGYVQLAFLDQGHASSQRETLKRPPPSRRSGIKDASSSYVPVVIITTLVLAAAFSIPYLTSASASK